PLLRLPLRHVVRKFDDSPHHRLRLAPRSHLHDDRPLRLAPAQDQPNMPRVFAIPGGRKGLLYAVGAPLLMGCAALLGSDHIALIFGPAAIAVGPIAYLALRRWHKPATRSIA